MFNFFAFVVMAWYIYTALEMTIGKKYKYLPTKVKVLSILIFLSPVILGLRVVGIL